MTSWKDAMDTEMHFASIIAEQEQHGWLVDIGLIHDLIELVDTEMKGLAYKVEQGLPMCPMSKGELRAVTLPKLLFKKDGTPSAACERFFDEIKHYGEGVYYGQKVLGGAYYCVEILPYKGPLATTRPMLLKDNKHIKDYLVKLGWKPVWWNTDEQGYKTSPKAKKNGRICPNLERMTHPVAKSVATYMSMRHRKAMLTGFTRIIRPDGRIPSECDTVSSATFRVKHRKIANLPNNESYFGTEIRSCFIAAEGYSLVSIDSDSCQMRMLAHYLIAMGENIDHPYIQAILYGTKEDGNDAHCLARTLAGLDTRSQGKTLNYALLFGQGIKALSENLGVSVARAKSIKAEFFGNVPYLSNLIVELEDTWRQKGSFKGLDGRPVECDSEHKLLNYLLQSSEAIYMKVVNCYIDKGIKEKFIDASQVCMYHDEITHEVIDESIEVVCDIQEEAMVLAGTWLDINVPMTGSSVVGDDWSQVH